MNVIILEIKIRFRWILIIIDYSIYLAVIFMLYLSKMCKPILVNEDDNSLVFNK